MKISSSLRRFLTFSFAHMRPAVVLPLAVASIVMSPAGFADTIVKADNADALNLTTSWLGAPAVVPGASDIALWDATVTAANNVVLGADLSWDGMRVETPAGNVTISAGNTLTLGASGIETVGRYLYLNSAVSLGVDQAWLLDNNVYVQGADGAISGNRQLTKNGGGLFQFNSTDHAISELIINAGRVEMYKGSAIGTIRGNITINDGGTLHLEEKDVLGYDAGVATPLVTVNEGGLLRADKNTGSAGNNNQGFRTDFVLQGGTVNTRRDSTRFIFSDGFGISSKASAVQGNWDAPIKIENQDMEISVEDGAAPIDLSVGSYIVGNGANQSITKTGLGTLRLNGVNTYNGTTTISEGVLQLGSGTEGIDGTINNSPSVVNDANLTYNIFGSASYGGDISGTGTVNKIGPGVQILAGNNNYSGATTIEEGTLAFLTKAAQSASTTVTATATGTVGLGVGGGGVGDYTEAEVGLIFNNNLAGFVLDPASGVALDTTAGDFTPSTAFTASRPLGKVGINSLILTGANTNTGTTTIYGGTVQLNNALSLQNSVVSLRVADGLVFNSGINSFTIGGLSGFAAQALTDNAAAPVALTIGNNANTGMTYSGALSGAGSLIKTGTGTQTLTGANTYTGATTVNEGTLASAGNAGVFRGTSALNVSSGATLELGGINLFVANHGTALANSRVITVDGGTMLMNDTSDYRFGNVTLSNGATWTSNRTLNSYDALLADTDAGAATVNVTGSGVSTMDGSGGIHLQGVQNFNVEDTTGDPAVDLDVSMVLGTQGTIGGAAGGIHKTGAGTMRLAAANLYTGITDVSEGTVSIAEPYLDDASTVNLATGAVLDLDFTGTDQVGALTIDGGAPLPDGNYNSSHPTYGAFFSGSGTLRVGDSDYDTWASGFLPADVSNMAGDNDNDGLLNKDEYAFGLDPTSGASVNPITVQLDKATGTFSYTRRDPALSELDYAIWTSTDLTSWTEDTTAGQAAGATDGDGNQTVDVTLTTPPTDTRFFVRVLATDAP